MIAPKESVRIGVYVCHCGSNIAGKVEVEELAEFASSLPGVVLAREYRYMCSDPGQEMVKRDIAQHNLDRVVVAACSPLLHEATFRKTAEGAGMNPFHVQIANIREHVAWVTEDERAAYRKAQAQVAAAVRRVALHEELERKYVTIEPRVLVVGGGIAGIQAALTLANAGKQVVLVEREPSIGGHMAMFDKTFPTLDCAACILTPKMTAVKEHPNIQLLTFSEVEEVSGSVGNYEVKVRRHARHVQEDLCVGCLQCIDACLFKDPKFENAFDQGLAKRKPIFVPFPQAVPLVPVIDPEACIELKTGRCKMSCLEACEDRGAIDFRQEEWTEEFNVGVIIVATGYQTFDPRVIAHYGYGRYENVYTNLEVERLLNASGPTEGKVLLRDGTVPKRVGIVHCVGSRDHHYHSYCSSICCMASLKLAHLIEEKTKAEVFDFYIDMRTPGKGFEEFYERVQREGINFVRGKVGEVSCREGDGETPHEVLTVQVDDTLLDKVRTFDLDMLILAVALEPDAAAEQVRRLFGMSCSGEGFFLEKHPKLAPVNTANDGVLLAGACQGAKDIPNTVAQAGAAAAEALALIDHGRIELEPNTSWIEEELCSGCKTCIPLCPYTAIRRDEEKAVAVIDETLCKGCGVCVAACPSGAARQHLFTDEQIYDEIEGVLCYV
jgi:heterodisulfide reductase subunit A2